MRGSASAGRDRSASSPACSRSSQPRTATADPVAGAHDAALLLDDVGDDQLGGVGRGRGADVGDQVEQRLVRLVADRGHDGGPDGVTARISASSENGSRSSTEPPPRAITMTSTRGVAVEPLHRLDHLAAER